MQGACNLPSAQAVGALVSLECERQVRAAGALLAVLQRDQCIVGGSGGCGNGTRAPPPPATARPVGVNVEGWSGGGKTTRPTSRLPSNELLRVNTPSQRQHKHE